MEKFKKKDRERILSDWRSCVPSMSSNKSMSLMKRNGPLIVGLSLREDRGNTSYKVIPYVHSLLRETSDITLTLNYPLRTQQGTYYDNFTLKSHDREFSDACKRLHKQTLFPLNESLSLSQIIGAYEEYIARGLNIESPIFLYEDIVSFFAWCGKLDEARRRLLNYVSVMSDWDDQMFRHVGEKSAFFDRLVEIVENRGLLEKTCETNVEFFKLQKVPDYRLLCS